MMLWPWAWEALDEPTRAEFMALARAAILALGEPSEEMKKAGGQKHSGNDYFSPEDFPEQAGEIFSAMIDVALEKVAHIEATGADQ
jgi:hypothetical protein